MFKKKERLEKAMKGVGGREGVKFYFKRKTGQRPLHFSFITTIAHSATSQFLYSRFGPKIKIHQI